MKTKASFYTCITVLVFLFGIALDQITKALAVLYLKGHEPFTVIPGVLELRYLENQGAAFGMLQNRQFFFWILTAVFLCAAVWVIVRVPKTRTYLPLLLSVSVLASGAVGNFIDRITKRYVVDFVYFSIIDFPIFNVADICVTFGVIILIILLLFRYKEEELSVLFRKKNRKNNNTQ